MRQQTHSTGQLRLPCLFLRKENVVPYVNVQITAGASREQKAEIVRDITDSLQRVLGKKPEHIHIVLQEIAEENWGYAGLLTDEWKRQQTT
ncbi:MAG TPA: 4-oxalocrotonate tautomerase family protein [Rhodocyclaceae bacterium]|nr:4-oxalocrotonate tautomerase family protein [Rhodocyclaceae bacterium]